RRRHTRSKRDWSSDVCSSDLRRHFFKQAGFGIGAAALSSLLNRYAFASSLSSTGAKPAAGAANPLAPKPPMFPAKAKSIIYLFRSEERRVGKECSSWWCAE